MLYIFYLLWAHLNTIKFWRTRDLECHRLYLQTPLSISPNPKNPYWLHCMSSWSFLGFASLGSRGKSNTGNSVVALALLCSQKVLFWKALSRRCTVLQTVLGGLWTSWNPLWAPMIRTGGIQSVGGCLRSHKICPPEMVTMGPPTLSRGMHKGTVLSCLLFKHPELLLLLG